MECPPSTSSPFAYPPCDIVTLFSTFVTWLQQHPYQAWFWGIALLVSLAFLWWWKGSKIFRQTANQRAEHLLKQSLTRTQYQLLQTLGFLELPSSLAPGGFYRVPRYRGRVKVYETYEVNNLCLYRLKAELCVVPCEDVPDADLILAHKWMIEGDEKTYRTIANWNWRQNQEWMVYSP